MHSTTLAGSASESLRRSARPRRRQLEPMRASTRNALLVAVATVATAAMLTPANNARTVAPLRMWNFIFVLLGVNFHLGNDPRDVRVPLLGTAISIHILNLNELSGGSGTAIRLRQRVKTLVSARHFSISEWARATGAETGSTYGETGSWSCKSRSIGDSVEDFLLIQTTLGCSHARSVVPARPMNMAAL